MNKYIIKIAGLGLLALSLVSCNKFLSQSPDDRTQINDVEAAKELGVTAYNEYSFVPLFEFRSDNVVDKGTRFDLSSNKDPYMYLYEENVPSTYQDSPQGVWRASYNAIATANQVLADLERTNATGEQADATKGEMLIARAYAMYMLSQAFTVPYDPATAGTDLGLPYPTEPEEELIKKYERGTLKELFEKISKDFEEGYKLVGNTYKAPKFHFTRQAAAAFGTRLYRTLHNWDRVIELGNDVFGNDIYLYTRKINGAGSLYNGTYYERKQVWGLETENCNLFLNVALSSWTRSIADRYALNVTLRDHFRKVDNDVVSGDNFLGTAPAYSFFGREDWVNQPKIEEHFKVTNKATGTGFVYSQEVVLCGDEVLFNMAEAYAMKNNFQKTEELLQVFVSNYMLGYDPADQKFKVTKEKIVAYYQDKVGKKLPDIAHGIEVNSFNPSFQTTPDQEMYLRACVDLKRLAFLHEGMRWLDNRQYRMDIVHNILSDGDSKEEFIVLRGNNPRYAYQLPANVLPYLEKNPGYDKELEKVSK